jgi:2-polyprenyl-3-methyl-5-hydroxy-6-metoxy-1,4-benzoquinol methylase
MVYTNPVPAAYASGEYYDQIGAPYYLSPAKLESDYAPVRFERELRLFRKYCSRGSVLDVGCSTGGFLYQLKEQHPGSYRVTGMDASGPALDYARSRGMEVVRGSFVEQPFGTHRFDAITLWAVLEHLAEPRSFVQRARDLLNVDGFCFVLVPNLHSLASRILGTRYRYVYPQHLNYFTRETLRRLVPAGFSIQESSSMHFNPVVIWQDWRGGGRTVSNCERAELLKRTTGYKQNPLLRPLKGLYRLTEGLLRALNLADNLVLVLRRTE